VVTSLHDVSIDALLCGEYARLRLPGEGEIFDADHGLLIVTPGAVTSITGDLGQSVFQKHGEEVVDPTLRLFDAAFDLLLREIGRDWEACFGCSWPDELVDIITDVLRSIDLSACDDADVLALAGEVIARIPRPSPMTRE
jgi:hypothetical protein